MAWQFEKLSKQTKRSFVICAMPTSLFMNKAGYASIHCVSNRTSRKEFPG
jgi:hypothetical protein